MDSSFAFPDPRTAELAAAAASGDAGRVNALVRSGSDANARGDKNVTLLQFALFHESVAGMEALLAAGADPNAADRVGNTPLHQAAKTNQALRALELLEAGADPAAANATGATFQRFLFRTPARLVTPEVRRGREAVREWLRTHDVPIEDVAAR